MVKTSKVDEKRRVTLPRPIRPGTDVTIQQLDQYTYLLKLPRPEKTFKMVLIPVIDKLSHDPEWDKVEDALGWDAQKKLPPPFND